MCGIAGFITRNIQGNVTDVLRGMASAIVHRGPDDEGFFETTTRKLSHSVGLAHRRLTIM